MPPPTIPSTTTAEVGVLVVCMGNICRSPLLQGLLEQRVSDAGLSGRVVVDSAGTGSWHSGEPPDFRSQAAASRRGIDISRQRAREITVEDFHRFDIIVVMDRRNERDVLRRCPPQYVSRVRLLLDYAPELMIREVPDPFHEQAAAFERVIDMAELAVDALVDDIRSRLRPQS